MIILVDVATQPRAPEVTTSERFETTNVVLSLSWTGENDLSYSVSIEPQAALTLTGEAYSAQLILQYNTFYNASIVASHGPCNANTTTLRLHYSKLYCMLYNNIDI